MLGNCAIVKMGRSAQMLFDDEFKAEPGIENQIFIWAEDEQSRRRIKFLISSQIQNDHLGFANPVHADDIIESCGEQREEIEAACERAYERAPSDRVILAAADFQNEPKA
jgi:hypothetical protein